MWILNIKEYFVLAYLLAYLLLCCTLCSSVFLLSSYLSAQPDLSSAPRPTRPSSVVTLSRPPTSSSLRKGGENSWSGPWHLRCTLEVFHVHSYQDQFIQPGWAECFCVCIFSLGLCFVCLFVLFVCLYPILLCFLGQLSHLPCSFWR